MTPEMAIIAFVIVHAEQIAIDVAPAVVIAALLAGAIAQVMTIMARATIAMIARAA